MKNPVSILCIIIELSGCASNLTPSAPSEPIVAAAPRVGAGPVATEPSVVATTAFEANALEAVSQEPQVAATEEAATGTPEGATATSTTIAKPAATHTTDEPRKKNPLLTAGKVVLIPIGAVGVIAVAVIGLAVLLPLAVAGSILICPFSSGGFCAS